MSKIETEFKLKDLYAIKHALEWAIKRKECLITVENADFECDEGKVREYTKDIEHEKQIVDYIVGVINKYKDTEVHY